MLKIELHTHTREDPHDHIPHSAIQLIDRVAELGYCAIAITLHDRQLDVADLRDYAASHGVVLIRGVERAISGKHVLLLNFGNEAGRVRTFEELAALKRGTPDGLVIAPHPFYPAPHCLGRVLERHADLFDAVEFNAFYTSMINIFNRAAVRWARRHGKPVVANTDVHRLWQLGRTYTLVDAAPTADEVCRAVKAGRIEIRTAPLSTLRAATYLADLVFDELVQVR